MEKWCVTNAVAETVIFNWTIEDFLTQCSSGRTLNSTVFTGKDTQWDVMLLYPRNDGTKVISLWISGQGVTDDELWAACKFSIGNDRTSLYSREFDALRFDNENYTQGFDDFITFENIKQYIWNGQLVVRCELKILYEYPSDCYRRDSESLTIPKCMLKDDMTSLMQDGKYTDVTLVAGKKQFLAHKLILCARSPVFARMFEHEMEESTTGKVDITDIRPEILQEVLAYIYTGDCPVLQQNTDSPGSSKTARELFYAADKYQLSHLKAMCENELSKTITVDNVAETLLYADMHNAQQLKQSCIRFILTKRLEVSKTPAWKEVKKHHNLFHAVCEQAFGETEEEPSAKRPRLS